MTIIDLICVFFVLLFLGFVFVCWQGRISTQSAHNRDIELANAGLQQEVQVITMKDCGEEFTVREVIWVPRAQAKTTKTTAKDLEAQDRADQRADV